MRRRYVTLGIAIFLVTFLALLPASLINLFIDLGDRARFTNVEGSLWSGSAHLTLLGEPFGNVDWSIAPSKFFQLTLGFDLVISNGDQILSAEIGKGANDQYIKLNGEISTNWINAHLEPYDLNFEGALHIQSTVVYMNSDLDCKHAEGKILWTGGMANFRLQNMPFQRELPPLEGTLSEFANQLTLSASTSNEKTPMLNIRLDARNGWIHLSIMQGLMRIADIPWPFESSDDDVVLELSEQYFQ